MEKLISEEETKDGEVYACTDGLEVLLRRVEEQMSVMADLKNQLEETLGIVPAPATVCEPKGAYHAKVQKETTLMADYILDENGKITNVQFNLVKRM